jgi:D-proline reductase (dithiol) PrdB
MTGQASDFIRRERLHVRTFYPSFEWACEAAPSPRNPMRVPLAQARVGLVSTAGGYARGQERFSLADEGDASLRVVGWDEPVRFAHGGYDTRRAYRDPEVVLPRETLAMLATNGVIGATAPRVLSLMGYIPEVGSLVTETAPRVAAELLADAVDLVLMVPT